MTLERDDNGEERLNGHLLTIRSLQTLPANSPFHNIFDPNNPVPTTLQFATLCCIGCVRERRWLRTRLSISTTMPHATTDCGS